MKQHITLLVLAVISCTFLKAQAPAGFNYQAVVRDNTGVPLMDQSIGYRFDIHQGSISGTVVFTEQHTTTSDDRGLVNMVIGTGSGSGDLNSVDWSNGPFYLEVSVDQDGGTNHQSMGSTQLNSVPYAMFAGRAEDVDDADADPANELQTLSINENSLTISDGNTVTVDGSSTNELQDLTLSGNTLSISQGNSVTLPDMPNPHSVAKAWVHHPPTGSVSVAFDAYNVASGSNVGTGIYVINLTPGLFSSIATNPAMVCQIRNDLAPGFCTVTSSTAPDAVTVRTYNASGTLANKEFSLIIFGR